MELGIDIIIVPKGNKKVKEIEGMPAVTCDLDRTPESPCNRKIPKNYNPKISDIRCLSTQYAACKFKEYNNLKNGK